MSISTAGILAEIGGCAWGATLSLAQRSATHRRGIRADAGTVAEGHGLRVGIPMNKSILSNEQIVLCEASDYFHRSIFSLKQKKSRAAAQRNRREGTAGPCLDAADPHAGEILCKPRQEQKPRLTSGLSAG